MKNSSLWYHDYRPRTLGDYIGNEDLKEKIGKWIGEKNIPHLLFYGPAGTGKTSLAKLIIENIKCDYIYLNASDENGIDTIREKVKKFASTSTFNPLKIIILDEADFLTNPAQMALRNIIDTFSKETRFILTGNHVERISPPLYSRCDPYMVIPPSKPLVFEHIVVKILDTQKVKYDNKEVAAVINDNYPDIRSIIKTLQSNTVDGVLKYEQKNNNYHTVIIDLLKSPTGKTWKEIRQIIADNNVRDYLPLMRHLYDNMEVFIKDNQLPQLTILLDEYMWRSASMPDKEINMMALVSGILKLK